MIDLHCHILPGLDDGAGDERVTFEMARLAAADGIFTVVCTPHIQPGVYNNTAAGIEAAVKRMDRALAEAEDPLNLVTGADVHMAPMLAANLRKGIIPTIARSRYFLFEPPHHVLPPRLPEFVAELLAAGYTPIVTHPERLTWIETHYTVVQRLAAVGAPMQITAGSILGRFGSKPKYWSERMLDEGLVEFVASDAHDVKHRPPLLSEARDLIEGRWGEATATRLLVTNPLRVLENAALGDVSATVPASRSGSPQRDQFVRGLRRA